MALEQLILVTLQQINWQLDTYNSLDSKTVGLLAFDGAVVAAFAVVHPAIGGWAVAVLVMVGLSTLFCLRGLVVRKVYVGPITTSLVSDLVAEDAEGVLYQLLADLGDATQRNQGPIAHKRVYWTCAAVALGFAILFGFAALVTG